MESTDRVYRYRFRTELDFVNTYAVSRYLNYATQFWNDLFEHMASHVVDYMASPFPEETYKQLEFAAYQFLDYCYPVAYIPGNPDHKDYFLLPKSLLRHRIAHFLVACRKARYRNEASSCQCPSIKTSRSNQTVSFGEGEFRLVPGAIVVTSPWLLRIDTPPEFDHHRPYKTLLINYKPGDAEENVAIKKHVSVAPNNNEFEIHHNLFHVLLTY